MKKGRSHRKQILLFLITILVPSLVLVFLTVRMIGQEKELTQKRLEEERSRMAREIGQSLLMRLENIKLQEMSSVSDRQHISFEMNYLNPEVELVCQLDGSQMVLPWEGNQDIDAARRDLTEPDFVKKIQQAEKVEFAQENFTRAAELYEQILKTTKNPVQREYSRLLLARTLWKSSRKAAALGFYRQILGLSFAITDEYGIPLSLYAARVLLDSEDRQAAILSQIQKEIQNERWMSPSSSYLLLDLLEDFLEKAKEPETQAKAASCKERIQNHIQKLEQVLALQSDFPMLRLASDQENHQKKDRLWILYGKSPWLVCLTGTLSGSPSYLVAVSAPKILTSLSSEGDFKKTFPVEFNLVAENDPEGLSLGSSLQGATIVFAENQEQMFSIPHNVQPAFYVLALFLILGITLFGAYLLWRDVRREVRMAEMRSQFVSSVSHELKTPLTAIRMFAETLRLGRSKNPKAQAEYLDTIVNESQRLTRLLNNVLDFSKIEQGKRIYCPEPASLYKIVESVARGMEYPLSQQGFRLDVQMENGLPELQLDRDAIEQAILNLLHNSMKYSGESREIGLFLKRKDGYAQIQVIDRGIGIDPQEQKRIFDKFYRVPSPENERIVGTGLGLSLVSHIVKSHGGLLEVESVLGKGSTFTIALPLEKES